MAHGKCTSESRKEIAEHLECHFKWKPSGEQMECDVSLMENKLLSCLDENHFVEVQVYSLLTYIFSITISGIQPNHQKALEYCDKALAKASCNGDKYVVLANRLNLQTMRRMDFEETYSEIKNLKACLNDKDHCRIKLIHAFSLTRFGLNEYNMALEKYKEAIKLNPESADGYFGISLILARLRRHKERHISKPSTEEMEANEMSYKLWNNTNPFAIVWYAYCIISDVQSYEGPYNRIILQELAGKCAKVDGLLKNAISLAETFSENSCIVYRWCTKGYKLLCRPLKKRNGYRIPPSMYNKYVEAQRTCVEKAIAANPIDSAALHEAGMFYWRVKKYKDLNKAEDLFSKACKVATKGNYMADIDYVILRKEKFQEKFSALDAYNELLLKYRNRHSPYHKLDLALLHQFIGKAQLNELGDKESAEEEFLEAIKLDPGCLKVADSRRHLLVLYDQQKEKSDFNSCDLINVLFNIAYVNQVTECYQEAAEFYCQILQRNCKQSSMLKARLNLCEIYFMMNDYAKCLQQENEILTDSVSEWKMPGPVAEILAKSHFFTAKEGHEQNSLTIDEVQKHLLQSVRYGLMEGSELLLKINQNNTNQFQSLDMYQTFSMILISKVEFSLDDYAVDELMKASDKIHSEILELIINDQVDCINIQLLDDIKKLRHMRLEITKQKMSESGREDTITLLQEARNQLDRAFSKFKEQNFPNVRKNVKYPYLNNPESPADKSNENLRKSQDGIEARLEKPREGMGLHGFRNRYTDLFQYLCKHQAVFDVSYEFVPEFCGLVNIHKHQESHHDSDLYALAHKACVYVEDFVVEISKYL